MRSRLVVLIPLAALFTLASPSSAREAKSAGKPPDRRPVVRFNASKREFVKWVRDGAAPAPARKKHSCADCPAVPGPGHEEPDAGGWVKSNRTVVLRLTNVNSFRETYRVQLDDVDLHTATLPRALEPYILTSKVKINGKESASEVVKLDAETLKQLPEPFGKLVLQMRDKLLKLTAELEYAPKVLDDKDLDAELLKMIYAGETNVLIRRAAADRIRKFLTEHEALPDDFPVTPGTVGPDGFTDFCRQELRDLHRYADLIPEAARNHLKEITELREGLKRDFTQWQTLLQRVDTVYPLIGDKAEYPKLPMQLKSEATWTPVLKGVDQTPKKGDVRGLLSAILASLQMWFDSLTVSATPNPDETPYATRKKDLEAVAARLERARTVFRSIIDPVYAPAVLEKTASAGGDLLKLSVEINVRPLSELEVLVQGLPGPTPPPGGPGGAGGPAKPGADPNKPGDPNEPGGEGACVVEGDAPGGGMTMGMGAKGMGTGGSGGGTPAPAPPAAPSGTINPGQIVRTTSRRTYDRWVLDYGLGLAATDLTMENFYKGPKNRVRRGASDSLDLGPAVLATYYPTTKSGFSLGPSFGLAQGEKTRYLAGLSLVTGGRNRFTLTVGAAFGKVDRLFGMSEGQDIGAGSVATKSVMRQGHFVSGTFTFTF